MQPVERLADKLEAPSLDDRSYRVIRLPNKLEALLVHDPETDKASASVNVKVGSFSDADDMPGMAHAVEHLLFMGTKKYPKENAYSQYLTSHSGYSNAYTASTETNYFFEVSVNPESSDSTAPSDAESPLYGALDRFAQFFVAPLFLSETLDRELKAVDSENKKNLQSDNWRLSQLNKSLSNPKHPYHHFSTGNLETLRDAPRKRGIEIRKAFMDFHDKHYSANRMKLVVLGKEPLDQLESWVADLFADVRNKDLPLNRWDGIQPYSEKEVLTQVFAKPVMDTRLLDIYFPYQDEEHMFTTQPSRYLSHLIGHEGPGSILAYIKAKGWANGLSAGEMDVCPGSAFFTISIRLTADGLKDYQEVVKTVFQYISLMKETPPQKWIVDEIKGMAEVDFRFKQKSPASSFTSRLSSVMQKPLPREWLLSGDKLIREFDADAITKAMSYLRTDNYRLTVVSQEFPGDWDHKEKWYGTEYRTEKISPDFEEAVRKAGESTAKDRPAELHLPHVNEFIPTRLTVEKKEVPEPSKAPKLIRNEEGIRTWWKKDDRFWVPKGNIITTLRSPLAGVTPMNVVKTKLYCELVKDALVEYSYDAEIAGLEYNLDHSLTGIDVDISGYSDKMPVLLEKVLVSMRDLEVKPDRFKIVKERILRGYRNNIFQQPYRQVGDYTRWLGTERGFITEQYLAELPHLTPEDISSFKPQLLHQMHIEILVHGNLYKEDALRMTSLIESTLKPRALPELQWQVRRNLILPKGSDSTYVRTLGDPANVNNCIEYYLYVGYYADMDLRARLLLLGQLTDEPGFDQLRTKEQLGYIVFTGAKIAATTMGYRVIIQSERSPEYLEGRINAFLAMFAKSLEDMTQQEFEAHKKSLINKRLEKIKNLDQETSRFWGYIGSEYFNFLQVETDVARIKSLTIQDLIVFFEHYIHPTAAYRAKLSVHMVAQTSPKQVAGNITPTEQKEKVLGLLTKYMTSLGVGVDEDKLASHFSDIDVAAGDQSAMISAVARYLTEDAQVPEEHSQQIIEQGHQLMSTILPSLGIEVQPLTDGAEDLPPVPPVKDTTFIENVHDYKAGLEATAGPRPLMDLSEFEESEPKL
ncbi:Insulinase (Peptidase M16) [Xylographa bjoerkii]|nr:Insulinase (Peptidase M16) [Xylographa bjoerkii]